MNSSFMVPQCKIVLSQNCMQLHEKLHAWCRCLGTLTGTRRELQSPPGLPPASSLFPFPLLIRHAVSSKETVPAATCCDGFGFRCPAAAASYLPASAACWDQISCCLCRSLPPYLVRGSKINI